MKGRFNMKKWIALLMGLSLIMTLAVFAGTGMAEEETAGKPAAPLSDTLVVYFSATGNTETAANLIAEATGADVFVLEPAVPYTDADLNWTDENSRVVHELSLIHI